MHRNEANSVSYYNIRNAACCYFLWIVSSRVICPKIGSREEKRLLDLRRDCRGGGGVRIPGIDDNDSLLKDNGVWSLLIDSQVTHFP